MSAVGRHNLANALAAVAVADILGIAVGEAVASLAAIELSAMRLAVIETSSGITIINDAYNANPASMVQALDVLVAMRPKARHFAALGMMAELGDYSVDAHHELGCYVAGLGIDGLVTVGSAAREIAAAALGEGLLSKSVAHFDQKKDAVSWLAEQMEPGDVVLVKASRAAGFENIAEGLRKKSRG